MRSLFLVVALVSMSFVSKVNAARAVFVGKVVKIEPFIKELDAGGSRFDKVTFNVEYSWKGAGFQEFGLPEFVVLLEISELPELGFEAPPIRGISFSENKKYLVFADERSDKKDPVIALWSLSKPLWDASDELKELRMVAGPSFAFRLKHVTP